MSAIKVHMARTSKYQTQDTVCAPRPKWNAGLYIRLSREDGDKIESESIGSQKALLEQFVSERPSLNFCDYYIDDGWSGTDFERPAFRRLMSDITTKKINCVIVKDLSRFGRNYVEAGKYLETVFPLFDVRFIAVNDSIDNVANPSSMNNVIVPFKNIMNDEYCRDISMKVRSSLDTRRRQGKFIGSFAPYGYKKDTADHNKLVIDEPAAETVRGIYRKFLSGYSIHGIVRLLNDSGEPNPSAYKRANGLNCKSCSGLWNDSTVRRILTNELYIGNLVQKKFEVVSYKVHVSRPVANSNRIVVENSHEAIVSREDFEKVESLLKRDTRTSPRENKLSVFSGYVKCADCGRAMQRRTVVQPYKTYEYYVCSTYRKLHGKACTKHAIRVDVLENTVIEVINKYIGIAVDFERLSEKISKEERANRGLKRLQAELSAKKNELEKCGKILLDIYPDYKNGLLSRDRYFALKEKYENSEEKIREAIGRIENEMRSYSAGVDGTDEFVKTLKKYRGLKELTRDEVVELIENICVREGGDIEIQFKFKDVFLEAKEFVEQNQGGESAQKKRA